MRKVVFAAASDRGKVQKMGKRESKRGTRERELDARMEAGGASRIEKGKRPKRSDENLISPILEKAGGALRRHYGTLFLPILPPLPLPFSLFSSFATPVTH